MTIYSDVVGNAGMDEGGDFHWCEAVVGVSFGVWLWRRKPKGEKAW